MRRTRLLSELNDCEPISLRSEGGELATPGRSRSLS